jgi:hypothetical protein
MTEVLMLTTKVNQNTVFLWADEKFFGITREKYESSTKDRSKTYWLTPETISLTL